MGVSLERLRVRRGTPMALSGLLLVGVSGLGMVQFWPARPAISQGVLIQADCVAWDLKASEGLAQLILDSSATGEWKLDQAILQLRRARKHCRSGSVQVAAHDYASLHRHFPCSDWLGSSPVDEWGQRFKACAAHNRGRSKRLTNQARARHG